MQATYSKRFSERHRQTGSSLFILIEMKTSMLSIWAFTTIVKQIGVTQSRAEVTFLGLEFCPLVVRFLVSWWPFADKGIIADTCNSWSLEVEAEAETENCWEFYSSITMFLLHLLPTRPWTGKARFWTCWREENLTFPVLTQWNIHSLTHYMGVGEEKRDHSLIILFFLSLVNFYSWK